jgi:serine/threonine protein kinase
MDGKYHLTNLVGLGGYGVVFLATGPIPGKKYAVKIMRNRSEELLESLATEVSQISKVQHINICNCLEYKTKGI